MSGPTTGGRGALLSVVILGALLAVALGVEASLEKARTTLTPLDGKDAPVVTSVEPAVGHAGEPLKIHGKNFKKDDAILVGGRRIEDDVTYTPELITIPKIPGAQGGEVVDIAIERTDDDDKPIARGVLPRAFTYEGLSRRGVILIGFLIACVATLGGPLYVVIGSVVLLGLFLQSQGQGTGFFRSVPRLAGGGAEAGIGAVILVSWLNKMTDSPLFIAIPLFTFAGTLMAESKTPERLINLSRALIGWLPGGIALVTLVACSLFTAFTGASGVTIIALGGLLYPILRKEGYDDRFSLGILTTCGSLGLLFPPSLPVIIYGIIAKVDIDRLFSAALLPGIMLTVMLGLYSMRVAHKEGVPRHPFSGSELAKSARAAIWEMPLPVLVIGGIYGGFITAPEAAAVTAFYSVIAQVFLYRDVKLAQLPRIVRLSMVLVGAILVILGMALALIDWLTVIEVPQKILALMKERIGSQFTFLLTVNVFLLVVGCIMEGYSATLVVVPLIAPIARDYGIDPYHLGVIFLLNLEIAYSMPPVGFNLFLSALRFGRPVTDLYKAALDFVVVMSVALLLVTYIPALSLAFFDTPSIRVDGAEGGSLEIAQGDERFLVATVAHAGFGHEHYEAHAKAAAGALAAAEAREGVKVLDLEKELKTLENATGDAAARREQVKRVKARLAALDGVAKADRQAKNAVLLLESMRTGIEWRSRQDKTVAGKGERFSTKALKPGLHAISATVIGDRGHLAQAIVQVRVVAKP